MFENLLADMPPITKAIMVLQIGGLLVQSLNLADRYDLYFNFPKIIYDGQIWRLVTSLFFFKKLSLFLFFEVLFV